MMTALNSAIVGVKSGLKSAIKCRSSSLYSMVTRKSFLACTLTLTLVLSLASLVYHHRSFVDKPSHRVWRPTLHAELKSDRLDSSAQTDPTPVRRTVPTPIRPVKSKSYPARRPQREKLKILVMSYMRSGSTLCGNILQAHPDVFYVYEPLLYLWDHYVPTKEIARKKTLRQRTKHLWRNSKPEIPPPLDFLQFMFRCNMSSYNLDFLTNVAHSKAFVSSRCSRKRDGTNVINVTRTCAREVQDRCDQSDAVVQKAVRLTMAEVGALLDRDPDIRVVHLVRDPRGVLLSRMRFTQKETGEMHKNYSSICRRLADDIIRSKEMMTTHAGRVLTVRYEDLAQDLTAVTSAIYEFVGLDMRPEVGDFLSLIQSPDHKTLRGNAKSSFRQHPFRTAYQWRSDLPFSLVRQVDRECALVYKALGYKTFRTEEQLRNLAIHPKLDIFGEGLLTPELS